MADTYSVQFAGKMLFASTQNRFELAAYLSAFCNWTGWPVDDQAGELWFQRMSAGRAKCF
jgi:hypothetical protein